MKTLPQEIEIGLVRVTNNVMLDFYALQGEQCDSTEPWVIGKSALSYGIDERKLKLVKIIESGLVRMFLAEIYNYMPECERKDSYSQIVHSAEYPALKRKLEETELELNTLKYLESHKNAKVRLRKKQETIRRASLERNLS